MKKVNLPFFSFDRFYCLLLSILFFGFAGCSPSHKFLEPDFAFYSIKSGKIGSFYNFKNDFYKVKYVVLNFFAPECPPCIEELPELQKLFEAAQKQKDILFIAVGSVLDAVTPENHINAKDTLSDLNRFKKKYALKYPVYLAGSQKLRSFRVTGYPETFVFKVEQGIPKLIRKFISAIKYEELKEYL